MNIICEEEILTMIRGVKAGNLQETEKLIEYYTPYIKSKCSRYNIHGFDFDDLASEGVKTLLKCIYSYKVGETSFTNYFFRAASNEFNYLLRKSYNDEALGEKIYSNEERVEVFDVDNLLWTEEVKEVLEDYIMDLTGEEKKVVEGIFYGEKTMAEVARELKFTFSKVQHIRNLFLRRIRENIIGNYIL